MEPRFFTRDYYFSFTVLFYRFLLFFNHFPLVFSDPRTSEAGLLCGKSRGPPSANYIPTFVKEMDILSQLVTNHHWGVVNSTPPVYGLAQCYGDLSQTDCLLCYAASRTRLPRCLPAASARVYFDGCFLRYDNYSFFNESTDPSLDAVNCSTSLGNFSGDKYMRLEFKSRVGQLVDNVTGIAASNGGFGAVEVKGIYGLAQCWKTLSKESCRNCLENAANKVKGCIPRLEGRGLNAGCYLRYSINKFYSNGAEKLQHNSGASSTGVMVAIALTVTAFFMLAFFAAYAAYIRFSKSKEERNNLGQISCSFNKSGLSFKYETLEKATNYFDPSRKIGQGGAGTVFKGILPNGQSVAVKRLFFNTRQWVDEFFNEVNLISGIQHKNLVKLLGCSIEGPESLLVYEYVPNKGLDQFLFDKDRIQTLNWEQRLNIIVGTAEGLAYLHGGDPVRIIHRDIKSSNVLLDENLTPKIADFGLVRCLAADKTHLSTGIAGTIGYMAPEYLVRGQLTEKADVYSFGVLVLEIICSRRNNSLIEDSSGPLLQTVWRLYKMEKLVELIDASLKDQVSVKEAGDVLRIGLLCTQASAAARPSMPEVIRMLTSIKYCDLELPEPNAPPFVNAKTLDPANSAQSSGHNTLISNVLIKMEGSSSYTHTTTGTGTESSSSMPSVTDPANML